MRFLKIPEESNSFFVSLWWIHYSLEPQCKFVLFCWTQAGLHTGVACRPWAGLYSVWDNSPSSRLVAILSPWTTQTSEGLKRFSVKEREEREKNAYHLLFKWNEVQQMVEEGLQAYGREPPALYLWFESAHNQIKKKKVQRNQQSWRISLAYFQWAKLEAEMVPMHEPLKGHILWVAHDTATLPYYVYS